MKNIVFMGTPSYASKILEEIYKAKFNILAIYTQPDKPVGRSQALTPPDVKKLAIDLGLNDIVYQPKSLKESGVKEHIKSLNPDIIIVAAYGQILPREILDIAPCVNLHASILPAYRGASPIQSAILDKNNLSGVTAMAMNEGLDSGDILAFSILDITNMNSYELFDKFSIMAANLTIKILNEYENINPIKQFDALSSKCKKIKKDDGLVDFSVDSASQIWIKFLAYYGWPGIFTKNGIKILDIEVANLNGGIGEILSINDNGFVVGVNNGSILIKTLQAAGKKSVDAKSYLNGKRLGVGDRVYL
ncbi:methionyl-tRNA formyltransferase [Campylobacter devanensis]|uniref:Methionyl-tRNA formyltransferase n=1 Tax=Campylobacter devanensis TaxID=3161138 RepID=A0A1X9STN7_9BACT|nr:methionyl-tRNA formyltransferase [Campylobacter lanienae]ARQ99607.1 10-formyltetrahydrofolate:L-methionyl-tRNA(fMet) N-formyltransferase [Campylobacter lanienae]SUX02839.1 methionyl-tRNA formyltransferase [Campylobacter lanienae]